MQENSISKFNFEQCQKCSICDSVCPMKEVNPLYPGPKQAGPDGERYRLKDPKFFDEALAYCLNCKRCEVACPSGVKVADLIAQARLKYGSHSHVLRNWTLANTDIVGTLAAPFAPIVNYAFSLDQVSSLMDTFLAVDKRRTFPSYSGEKFITWFRKNAPSQEGFKHYITYFHGCYVNYNFPQLGKDFVTLLNACGYGVRLMEREKCCGTPAISGGFTAQAVRQAKSNMAAMKKALAEGSEAVLTSSSSCTFTMRDEYPNILGVDNSEILDSLQLATKWIFEKVEAGEIHLAFRKGWRRRAAYHTSCHINKMGWPVYSISLLKMIPGMDLKVIPSNCCGICGTFGFKKENYRYSQAIGAKLFEDIRLANVPEVVTDCETCKWQIEMCAGLPVMNPVSILAEAMDEEETIKMNIR